MPLATARRADSAGKRRGRPGKSSPFQITFNGSNKDKGSDWRAQLLMRRHHVSPSVGGLILSLHFGEGRHA
ncbi:hypothetical protein YP76_25440 [Sphingobium chungbukense]|uniref:Uncharacterized protein n=1 Tax=Sphingobium chungbukense TaxID=56193 RepID=A0A0M3AH58_9SPHN|nr:hypothetical protein YP76_25440 [Sphingobium chungbukense]